MVVLNHLHYLIADLKKIQISKYKDKTRQRNSISIANKFAAEIIMEFVNYG
jgi:hypothetical protein